MENLLKNIEELREKILKTMELLDIERKKSKAESLKLEAGKSGFWENHEEAVRISKKIEELESEVKEWDDLRGEIRSLEELVAEADELKDDSIDEDAHKQYKVLAEKYAKLEFYVLFSHKYDEKNAVVSVHAGTGGVDAQDWAEILSRMYMRFCEKKEWKTDILDRNYGNEAGIKSISFHVRGRWAYGYLKSESGVHRLVRISPFDAESMRHTSFALVEVIPELPEVEETEIRDDELRIDVYRSSGPGGQSVNTTDSAVRVTHIPTGIAVACQNERSQHQNKETALRILKSKLCKLEEERKEVELGKLKGDAAEKAEWGKQIRSYVMQPYQMVKDHRSKYETSDINSVLDGSLEGFMEAYLRYLKK